MIKEAIMSKTSKIKTCRYCGSGLTEKDPLSRKQCIDCSIKRMRRWRELQGEAKRKFDEEWS